jgi:hypothetical protein
MVLDPLTLWVAVRSAAAQVGGRASFSSLLIGTTAATCRKRSACPADHDQIEDERVGRRVGRLSGEPRLEHEGPRDVRIAAESPRVGRKERIEDLRVGAGEAQRALRALPAQVDADELAKGAAEAAAQGGALVVGGEKEVSLGPNEQTEVGNREHRSRHQEGMSIFVDLEPFHLDFRATKKPRPHSGTYSFSPLVLGPMRRSTQRTTRSANSIARRYSSADTSSDNPGYRASTA